MQPNRPSMQGGTGCLKKILGSHHHQMHVALAVITNLAWYTISAAATPDRIGSAFKYNDFVLTSLRQRHLNSPLAVPINGECLLPY